MNFPLKLSKRSQRWCQAFLLVLVLCLGMLSACSAKPQASDSDAMDTESGIDLDVLSYSRLRTDMEPVFPEVEAPSLEPEPEPEPALMMVMCPASDEVIEATLEAAIAFYVECHMGTYGAYIVDLTTSQTYEYNADHLFRAASTSKLPLAMYVLKLVDQGELRLSDRIVYDEQRDWETGTGSLQSWIQPGVALTIELLIDRSITESDNIAKNMLQRHVGQENLLAWMRTVGGIGSIWEEDSLATTPREMALFMQLAATPEFWQEPELGQWLVDLMTETIFPIRTQAGVPDDVPVAHKIGSWPGVVNDIGLVLGERPFIISLFSHGIDHEEAEEVLAGVTELAYRYIHLAADAADAGAYTD